MRELRSPICSMLVLALLACGGGDATGNPAPPSYVIVYTAITDTDCRLVTASLDGHLKSLPSATCGDDAAWTRDGQRIAFEKHGGASALWTVNADGTGAAALPGGDGLERPEWSPDGSRIAAIAEATGTIVIINANGTGRIDLPASIVTGNRPSWSSDGASILFAMYDTVRTVAIATGEVHVVAVPSVTGVSTPRWSPDQSRISFIARAPERLGIYVIDADGSNQQLLIDTDVGSSAAWSPDGRSLVYAAAFSQGFANNIFVLASDGSGTTDTLTSNVLPQNSYAPDWALTR
jgi:Tol biopolymer transport system component